MGRRRWRFVTIAAFLLYMIKDAQCQDENDFYYTPVERSFAQVQPPLYTNSRPTVFYEHGDNYRAPTQSSPQPLYNEGQVRFPSPNYNQNPAPFQLHTGRSQAGTPYYINQPEFNLPRQRYRQPLPKNFQIAHPASTKRPDTSEIHSAAYQNDPSKPETFLGQITLNNPDIDYLQNSRFKNVPFDGNRINGHIGHATHDEDIDNQDLFDSHRVTTYNPKIVNKQRLNIRPSSSRLFPYDSLSLDENTNSQYNAHSTLKPALSNKKTQSTDVKSTENKAILELEPLLEDDISDISSFRELMKNTEGSHDVQVIKSNSNSSSESMADSKPDASSMNTDNLPKEALMESVEASSTAKGIKETNESHINYGSGEHGDSGEGELEGEDEEYVEYYDDEESSEVQHSTHEPPEKSTDIYDEYDTTEEPEKSTEHFYKKPKNSLNTLASKSNPIVKENNVKQLVDTTETINNNQFTRNKTTASEFLNISNSEEYEDDVSSIEIPSILGQEVVSVVTTKSVVNGTISIPNVTYPPSTTKMETLSISENNQNNDTSLPVTTENWIVVASVQTSRSVSGARFLPFPTVEQEEKKQVLTDEKEENEEAVTQDPRQESKNSKSSTENINDKLDSIQSELSSAVLSGNINNENKNIEHITESTTEQTSTISSTTTTSTTTPASLNVFTLKSTQTPTVTEKSSPDPLPVQIKKFTPRVSTSTTQKPRKKLVTVMDDLAGFLPPGYKPRLSFKDKRTSTTPPTTTIKITTTTQVPLSSTDEDATNGLQARSSGDTSKNKVIVLDDKSLLPKDLKLNEKPIEDLFKKIKKDDLSMFLPPGYMPPATEEPTDVPNKVPNILDKATPVDITAFLPKGFNLSSSTSTEKPANVSRLPINAVPVDISAFLPPGFKLNSSDNESSIPLKGVKIADVSSLLPPGFKLNTSSETPAPSSTTKVPGGIKLVFPSRPGNKATRKTTPKPDFEMGPSQVTPKIQKGWPTRASTEFTGWPSSSTTPFSIEKFLNKTDGSGFISSGLSTEATTRRTTTTTTTTPTPPPSTTPGICRHECEIAATVKIVSGVNWVPEFLDHHTEEWQNLANDVKEELNSVYSKSEQLGKWYKGIRIDGFSKGSVLVDYFIELNNVEEKVDTLELKKIFHTSLNDAKPGSAVMFLEEDSNEEFNPDVMLGDQPDEERMKKSNEKMMKAIDISAGKLEIGKFVMDPAFTEFIVLPKRIEPTIAEPEEESFLPQWGIAVIVIALASLLFVIIFGVTVLVNRQKSAKAKQPIPLSEDMLRELDKSHMGGFDDVHQMKERDLPYLPTGKRMSTAFIEQLAYPNPGDSWRSEWTPQIQKYMQHYTPDSGRGSQIYGTAGNAYGYGAGGGSQLYGQTGGGGSQVYGYTGEYPPRSHYARRRSEYDSNF